MPLSLSQEALALSPFPVLSLWHPKALASGHSASSQPRSGSWLSWDCHSCLVPLAGVG